MEEYIRQIMTRVKRKKAIQGHICINNSDLFDLSITSGIYGFPGQGNTTVDNLKVTAWRAISSLYNIGKDDLIFLYRTNGKAKGSQEFHGLFQVLNQKDSPLLFIHPKDQEFMPRLKGTKYLPFRFLFTNLMGNPISIPNDLRNKTYKKNNNLEIIKALSETGKNRHRLWGFRHPSVMNIGAARKSSIVAISNKQVMFLLNLLLKEGVERPVRPLSGDENPYYNPQSLPKECTLLDSNFLEEHFYNSPKSVTYEAELYAYIIHALKNRNSSLHKGIIEDFSEINNDMDAPFENLANNVVLEAVLTPHMQEEIDILLCDHDEKNFLIMEIKNDIVTVEDVEQCKKYIQLVRHQFPDCDSVTANVIGLRTNVMTKPDSEVKIVNYEINKTSQNTHIDFRKAN